MIRCKICMMTDQRLNLQIDEEGVCNSCRQFEHLQNVDWSKRWLELDEKCNKYRKRDGSYDCIIAVSGGKDSYFQVNLFKELLGMHPLGIMIDNSSWTETGRKNFYNLSERYDMDILTFTPSRKKMKARTREDFLTKCHPNIYWDEVLYRKPLELAQKLGIKLVIWGEDTNLFVGNGEAKETPNAKRLIPDPENFEDLEVIFTSYYVPWDRFENVRIAKLNGFKGFLETGEWKRGGFIEMFEDEQVDTIGYLVAQYTKFIKFGYSTMTELCSNAIRSGKMTREEALEVVKDKDWWLDVKMEKDFCEFTGITEKRFWEIIDKFANKDLLVKRDCVPLMWRLKNDAV